MAIVDRLKYDAVSDEWLVWKYPGEQIKLGAQLVVNQTQEALFFKSGLALDLFGPGTHTLVTGNLPLLSKLIVLPFGGETPFTAEVWFVNKHAKRDLLWGTKTPIPIVDPVYKYPVSVRAYGRWGVRVTDSRILITQLVGSLQDLRIDRLEDYFGGEIGQRLSNAVAAFLSQKGISVFQANSKLNELSSFIAEDISREFGKFGLEIINFNIERVSILEKDQERLQEILGKKLEIEELSKTDLGPGYTTARTFDVLEKAAENEGGAAGGMLGGGLGLGVGLGAGVPVGKNIGDAIARQPGEGAMGSGEQPEERLRKLKKLFEEDLITREDYETRKKQILEEI